MHCAQPHEANLLAVRFFLCLGPLQHREFLFQPKWHAFCKTRATMKNKIKTTLAFLSAIFVLTGCGDREKQDQALMEDAQDSLNEATDAIARESSQAWQDLKDATYDERQQVSSYFSNLTDKAEEQYNQIKESAQPSDAYDEAMAEMDEAYDAFKEQMNKLGNATEENWAEARDRTYEAWQNFMDSMDDLTNSSG